MQGGGGSYIGAVAEPHACCKEMDLSEGLWNSAGGASLTAPAPSVHYHIRTKCVCVFVKRHGGNRCSRNNIQFGSFLRSKHMFRALTRTCFPSDNHFTENYLIAYEGSNSLSEDNPGTIQPQLKYTSAAVQEKKKQTLPHYPSPRIYTCSSQTSFEQHCEGGKGSVCVCVCVCVCGGGGVFATVAFNHVPFYWFESGSNLVSGLCKVLCCIKSRP